MILAVKIGNDRISFGVFENSDRAEVLHGFEISADIKKTADEYSCLIREMTLSCGLSLSDIDGAILSSVVPCLTETISETINKLVGVQPMTVGPGVKTGFPIKTDNPSELGADLVANAAAIVLDNDPKIPAIIIDMNTATTIFAINKKGEYIGGCILPGIRTSFDSLRDSTALLPNVSISVPDKAIGKNSADCVRSGVILGNAIMIDGFIEKIENEMGCANGEANLFATGEYAELLVGMFKRKVNYVADLTLKGLLRIYKKNH